MLKWWIYFKSSWILGSFEIQIDINLDIFGKSCKTKLFRKRSLWSHIKTHINRVIMNGPLKKWKLWLFGGFFFKKNLLVFWSLNEFYIWAKIYHIWKIVNYCWNHWSSKLLVRLDQRNNKQKKIAVNLAVQFFERSIW